MLLDVSPPPCVRASTELLYSVQQITDLTLCIASYDFKYVQAVQHSKIFC